MRFAGIDIPAAGGSLLPALSPVADYLRQIDPETLPLVQAAMRIAESFAGASAASAAPAWTRLPDAEQDALSALLMRLLIRFRAVALLYVSRGDQHSYDIALRRLEAACHADYGFRAMAGLYAGNGLTADTSARDVYMAGSVLWHLERLDPGSRIVLAAHNAHIQKTPISFNGHLTGLPMGQHLHSSRGPRPRPPPDPERLPAYPRPRRVRRHHQHHDLHRGRRRKLSTPCPPVPGGELTR